MNSRIERCPTPGNTQISPPNGNATVASASLKGEAEEATVAVGRTQKEPRSLRIGENAREPLLDAAGIAHWLGVDRGWVYENAAELGALRLGSGPRARLRFDPEIVRERLTVCSASRASSVATPRTVKPKAEGGRWQSMGTNVALLPIRGMEVAA
jgi:hypothetical protein